MYCEMVSRANNINPKVNPSKEEMEEIKDDIRKSVSFHEGSVEGEMIVVNEWESWPGEQSNKNLWKVCLFLNVETAKQAKEVEKEARRGKESNFNMVELKTQTILLQKR